MSAVSCADTIKIKSGGMVVWKDVPGCVSGKGPDRPETSVSGRKVKSLYFKASMSKGGISSGSRSGRGSPAPGKADSADSIISMPVLS